MKLTIAWIGKTKNAAIQSLTDEFLSRLRPYTMSEGVSVRDEAALLRLSGRDQQSSRRKLILFDAKGRQFSSEELAQFLRKQQDQGLSQILFAIGPADGFSEETRRQAEAIISLGRMTLPHELARVVVLEQLYRAFTILKGHPYHLGH